MKPTTKPYSILFLIVFLVVSCGPVTPVAEPTATKSPIPLIVPSATSSFSALTLSPSDGPDKDGSSYRLRSWTEEDYDHLVKGLDDLVGEEEGQIPYFMLPEYLTVFESEHLLRFPNSAAKRNILWSILPNNPGAIALPGNQSKKDLMSLLILDLLAQDVLPSKLSSELEKHNVQVLNTLTVPNITGIGESGLVLLMRLDGSFPLVGVFVISHDKEGFQVYKVRDWEAAEATALYRDFEIHDVSDTNANGLPEIVVQIEASSSDISKETIDHVEWSPEKAGFQNKSFPVFWQTCEFGFGTGPCQGEWKFSTLNTQNILITQSNWFTRDECPNLTIRHVFAWDKQQYDLQYIEMVPPGDEDTDECRLAWAETAISNPSQAWEGESTEPGWKNDLAISIIEKSLNNWPDKADKIRGPAGRDYFKLKLGMWYEFRNQGEKTQSLLQSLALRPHQADFDFMSRLASLYLKERASSGKVRACLSLENEYFEQFQQTIPDPSPFNNDDAMLAAWGIVDGKGSLCDVYDMLPAEVKAARLTSSDSLIRWLERTKLTAYQNDETDLNNDGLTDHLVVLDTTDSASPDAWAFLSTPNGYQAGFISEVYSKDEHPSLDILPINTGDGTSVNLIASEQNIAIFRVDSDLTIKNIFDDYGIQSFAVDEAVLPVKLSLQIDNSYDGQKSSVYLWDSSTRTFIEQTDSFITTQAEIENLLYVREDYEGVIKYIDEFLQGTSSEPKRVYACGADIPDGCSYLPDWYLPYFRYIRGLAYEQLHQADQAQQAYYDLWKTYPKNLFGMAASLKMEPINP